MYVFSDVALFDDRSVIKTRVELAKITLRYLAFYLKILSTLLKYTFKPDYAIGIVNSAEVEAFHLYF